uniref:Uncharacterized protein n=1 Tax=Toxarium undulatum TaxID=210620 RepID=A0A2U9GI18_9STRA|nr:hypothetical protein [Toxarium undulatum]AWQ64118.1 hypothetical protein [Toxarium undulatum]
MKKIMINLKKRLKNFRIKHYVVSIWGNFLKNPYRDLFCYFFIILLSTTIYMMCPVFWFLWDKPFNFEIIVKQYCVIQPKLFNLLVTMELINCDVFSKTAAEFIEFRDLLVPSLQDYYKLPNNSPDDEFYATKKLTIRLYATIVEHCEELIIVALYNEVFYKLF